MKYVTINVYFKTEEKAKQAPIESLKFAEMDFVRIYLRRRISKIRIEDITPEVDPTWLVGHNKRF